MENHVLALQKKRAFRPVTCLDLAGIVQAVYQDFPVSAKKKACVPSCKLPGVGGEAAGNVSGIGRYFAGTVPGLPCFCKKRRALRPVDHMDFVGRLQAICQDVPPAFKKKCKFSREWLAAVLENSSTATTCKFLGGAAVARRMASSI